MESHAAGTTSPVCEVMKGFPTTNGLVRSRGHAHFVSLKHFSFNLVIFLLWRCMYERRYFCPCSYRGGTTSYWILAIG